MTGETFLDHHINRNLRGATAARPIFLHTAWRSRGSWIWSALRDAPGVDAFYEPLHEDLRHATRRSVTAGGAFRHSGHCLTAPYFAEYAPLFARRGALPHFARRFAYDDWFREPGQDDPALAAYLASLLNHARTADRVPVLKFCRSQGRVGWFARRYPEALHLVLTRDPVAIWHSACRQHAATGNRFFLAAPWMVLGLHATHPLVADLAETFGVTLPVIRRAAIERDLTIAWHHRMALSEAAQYRGHLVFWLANALRAALGLGDARFGLAIDSDEMVAARTEPPGATRLGRAIATHAGILPRFGGHDPPPRPASPSAPPAETASAHRKALQLITRLAATLDPGATAILIDQLERNLGGTAAPTPSAHRIRLASTASGTAPPQTARARLLARADYTLWRAAWPLRRLNRALHPPDTARRSTP